MSDDKALRRARRETVEELFRRISRGDFEGAVEFMTDDFRFELPYVSPDVPRPISGRGPFLQTMKQSLGAFGPFGLRMLEFHDQLDPDTLIAEYTSNTHYLPTGRPYSNRYVGMFRFAGDRIRFWREYHNPDILAEAMRPSAPHA
jgi:ketosteroid isomerase-like protein